MLNIKRIQAVVFDWGETLFERETNKVFPGAEEVLDFLARKKGLSLAIVSIAASSSMESRFQKLNGSGFWDFISMALFTENPEDKKTLYRNILGNLMIHPSNVLAVDDRIVRLDWPIQNGCQAAWLCRGKFKDELPSEETGFPTVTISSLVELIPLFGGAA